MTTTIDQRDDVRESILALDATGDHAPTWQRHVDAKRDHWASLPFFWLTPLMNGLRDAHLCDADRELRSMYPLAACVARETRRARDGGTPDDGAIRDAVGTAMRRYPEPDHTTARDFYRELHATTDVDFDLIAPPTTVGAINYDLQDGRAINGNVLKHLYQYWQVAKRTDVFDATDAPVILEIGAGYGGLLYQVLSNHPDARIVIVDIPNTMVLSHHFLTRNFPDATVALHTDAHGPIDLSAAQIHFVPNTRCHLLAGAAIDVVINSESLLEMQSDTVDAYFDLIQSWMRARWFYNYNRAERREGDEVHTFDALPYDDRWEHVHDAVTPFRSHGFPGVSLASPIRERVSRRI